MEWCFEGILKIQSIIFCGSADILHMVIKFLEL